MVMSFNTDVTHGGLVYHVQTETRRDAAIETTVYLQGAVIHQVRISYREFLVSPDYNDEKLNERVEAQHRHVIKRIRGGLIAPSAQAEYPS